MRRLFARFMQWFVKTIKVLGLILMWTLLVFSIFMFFSIRWMLSMWASLNIEEHLYHLRAPLTGTDYHFYIHYMIHSASFIIASIIACIVILCFLKKHKPIVYTGFIVISVLLLVITCIKLEKKLGVRDYIKSSYVASTFIEDNYISPDDLDIEFPDMKKNLIYIYLESMEMTYTDSSNGGAFKENIIPELVDLSREGEDFSGDSPFINGAISLYGSEWTMGAMFAQSTGLPLKTGGVNGNYISSQNEMYPSVKGLGDILEDNGYTNELLIGSNATFGGRDTFFRGHGNYILADHPYAIENGWIPADYNVFWGYEDEKLFEFARNEATRLSKEDKPFNLTMLTVDTHFEDGYKCRLCEDKYNNGDMYSNVMACSSKQVSGFIDWLKQQDFYDDTVVVLVGDHPTMDSDFCKDVPADYQRRVVTTILNSDLKSNRNDCRSYSTMDMFPTTLAAMGVTIPGDRLGLGVNLYSDQNTLIEEYGRDYCNKEMVRKSDFMNSLNKIEFNEDLVACIYRDSRIEMISNDDGVEVRFWTNTYFNNIDEFDRLEADVVDESTQASETINVGYYYKEGFYSTGFFTGYNLDSITVNVYLVDTDGERHLVGSY